MYICMHTYLILYMYIYASLSIAYCVYTSLGVRSFWGHFQALSLMNYAFDLAWNRLHPIPYTLQAVANQGCCEIPFCIVFAIIHPLHLKIGKDLRSSWIFLNVLVVNWLKYANSLKLPQSKRLQEYICILYIVYCSVQSVSPYGKLPQQIGVEQCEIFAWIKLSKLFPSWRPISSSSSPSPSLSLSLSC